MEQESIVDEHHLTDTELEWAWGTIIVPEPEEFAFICVVRLDDGRERKAIVGRDNYFPGTLPAIGDRVYLIVDEGLCLVTELQRHDGQHDKEPAAENDGSGDSRHTIAERFNALRDEWKSDSQFLSSPSKMAMLSSYQQIIALGPSAIPLILAELRREPDHWFWALEALSGANPVPQSARGNLSEMTECWLAWAKEAEDRLEAYRRGEIKSISREDATRSVN